MSFGTRKLFKILIISFLVFSSTSHAINPEVYEFAHPPQAYSPVPAGLVDVLDVVPGIHLDLRYATTNNFMGKRLDGYKAARAFLLPGVAKKLLEVQMELEKKGLALKIYDAYRPLRAERQMLDWARDTGHDNLLKDGYLYSHIKPWHRHGHSCGNCVDLTIVDKNGRELDMGSSFDDFSEKSWIRSATGKALENRLLLRDLMAEHGFRDFYKEWWHFTYWDEVGPLLDIEIQ